MTILRGHTDGISCAAFSPDEQLLVRGSYDKKLRLWELTNQQSMVISKENTNWIKNILRLWDGSNHQCVATLKGHTGEIECVTFNPDGKLIASGSEDQTVRLWRVEDQKCVAILRGHIGRVTCIAFSPDGKWLASGGFDNTVRLWRVEDQQNTMTPVATLQGHTDFIWDIAFSPDGKWLASGSSDNTVRLWRVEYPYSTTTPLPVMYILQEKGVKIENTMAPVATLQGHTDFIRDIAFSPDGKWLASGSRDCTLRLWSIDTKQCLAVLKHDCPFSYVSFNSSGDLLTINDGEMLVWKPCKIAKLQMSIEQFIYYWEKEYALYCNQIRLIDQAGE